MRPLISLLIWIMCFSGFAQDLIIKKDSSKIYCRIIAEDSLTLQYYSLKENNSPKYTIKKSDVLKYYNKSGATAAQTAKQQAKLDSAERIYRAKTLVKGVYKNYREFIANSPYYTADIAAVERNQAELMLNHGSKYAYSVNGNTIISSDNYGFCDGKNAYVNYDHPKGFCKIDHLGPYSLFTYTVHGMGALAMIPDQLMLVEPNGEFKTATVKNVKKILKQENPELLQKYEAEVEQKDKRTEYIVKLNEYLMSKK